MTRIERNKEIYRLYRSGVDMESLARTFDIYSNEIYSIAYSDINGSWKRLGAKVRQEIRQHNDINRKYLVIAIIDALQLIARPRKVLSDYAEWKSREISIKEFMDLIVSENQTPRRSHITPNVMRLRNMGRVGFWNILEQLTTLDLGENARVEWTGKIELLKKYGRKEDIPRFLLDGFQRECRVC